MLSVLNPLFVLIFHLTSKEYICKNIMALKKPLTIFDHLVNYCNKFKRKFCFCLRESDSEIQDANGEVCSLFPEVRDILSVLAKECYLGIASRIENICSAYQILNLFHLCDYFPLKEIYPASKRVHLTR